MSKAPSDRREKCSERASSSNISSLSGTARAAASRLMTRQLRLRLVRAHRAVDAMHLGHHRSNRSVTLGAVVAPEFDADGCAHDRFLAAEPAPACGARQHRARVRGARLQHVLEKVQSMLLVALVMKPPQSGPTLEACGQNHSGGASSRQCIVQMRQNLANREDLTTRRKRNGVAKFRRACRCFKCLCWKQEPPAETGFTP